MNGVTCPLRPQEEPLSVGARGGTPGFPQVQVSTWPEEVRNARHGFPKQEQTQNQLPTWTEPKTEERHSFGVVFEKRAAPPQRPLLKSSSSPSLHLPQELKEPQEPMVPADFPSTLRRGAPSRTMGRARNPRGPLHDLVEHLDTLGFDGVTDAYLKAPSVVPAPKAPRTPKMSKALKAKHKPQSGRFAVPQNARRRPQGMTPEPAALIPFSDPLPAFGDVVKLNSPHVCPEEVSEVSDGLLLTDYADHGLDARSVDSGRYSWSGAYCCILHSSKREPKANLVPGRPRPRLRAFGFPAAVLGVSSRSPFRADGRILAAFRNSHNFAKKLLTACLSLGTFLQG